MKNNEGDRRRKEEGGLEHYDEKVEGYKVGQRSDSLKDYYSEGKLYKKSLSEAEEEDLGDGF
ncbi:hypothetical protein [Staphylococcus hominis]|uniref:hypothetical protein n=1 Tax=Staphylococcus hominis TaxID=1290 RepID=UPI0011A48A06|nr:hypothetical protein [Staphylococcus hominis]